MGEDHLDQESERSIIMHQRVCPDPSQEVSRRHGTVGGTEVWPHLERWAQVARGRQAPCTHAGSCPRCRGRHLRRERSTPGGGTSSDGHRSDTLSFGNLWRTPPMSRQQTAVAVSAGIPTSQGSQYLDMRPPIWRSGWGCRSVSPPTCMSQGWTNSTAPSSSQVLQVTTAFGPPAVLTYR